MPFESKGTLQKFHMTNTPPEIYKYDNNNKYCCTKMAHFVQCEKNFCQGQLRWVIFKRKFLNLLYHSDSWSLDFKVKFRPLQRNIPTTLLCLIAEVYYISRVSVVPQKTNNVVVGCHYLCWVPFFQGRFFNKRGALFLTLWQWVP